VKTKNSPGFYLKGMSAEVGGLENPLPSYCGQCPSAELMMAQGPLASSKSFVPKNIPHSFDGMEHICLLN
jgi:hypothetical protein